MVSARTARLIHHFARGFGLRISAINDRLHGRSPRPDATIPGGEAVRSVFDSDYYLTTYSDVQAAGIDPFLHYMTQGWLEGRNPSEAFDTEYYLGLHSDVRESGMNPLFHYVQFGRVEGRSIAPDPAILDPDPLPLVPGIPLDWERARPEFDADYYLRTYLDVQGSDIDPFLHYMAEGWTEGRNPSEAFDTDYYLGLYPDVREIGTNPLLHYVMFGRAEGRTIAPDRNDPRTIIDQAKSPSELARSWMREPAGIPLSRDMLTGQLAAALKPGNRGLVVSISHDDFVESVGGTQIIIADEMQMLVQAGFGYLHLCPAQPLPMLAPPGADDLLMRARLSSRSLGVVRFSDLVAVLADVRQATPNCYLIVHHLLGHRPEDVAELVRAVVPDRVFVYLHDFFPLCMSYNLLRNDVSYCEAPDPSSGSCMVCCYGEERGLHLARMNAFFAEIRPTMCIYSDAAREIWSSRNPFVPLDILPIRLARVELRQPIGVPAAAAGGQTPLRVAFLGTPRYSKGWNVFASLAKELQGDQRYTFVQLSAQSKPQPNITHVRVSVRAGDRLAMVRALREARIDVALIWSLWPETFCFTAYEAMAAGAYVVTCSAAGNVWPGVRATGPGQGLCLDTTDELRDLFATGDIIALACVPGRKRGNLIIEAPLADHILQCGMSVHA